MNAEVLQTPQLSTGRWLLLGVASLVLCLSYFMAPLAPFPLALSAILYGRPKGYLLAFLCIVASFFASTLIYGSSVLFGFYVLVAILGIGLAEIALRAIAPVKGVVIFGLLVLGLLFGVFATTVRTLNITPKQLIIQQIEKSKDQIAEQKKMIEQSTDAEALQVLQILDKPELIADEVMEILPSYLFIFVFAALWFNMFLLLKFRRVLLSGSDFEHNEMELLRFKVPFPFVVVLSLGLVMAVWGGQLGVVYEKVGFTIIYCLGVFYFFQGFGVFSDLLNFLGVRGFFRTFIVIMVIFMARHLIAVAGLFDNWFDFRKYFVKRKTED